MSSPLATVERKGRAAVIRLHGDLVVSTAAELYSRLRAVAKRRTIQEIQLDFSDAGRVDSSGIAVVSLVRRQLARYGKKLELIELQDKHRTAFEMAPAPKDLSREVTDPPGLLERIGDKLFDTLASARGMFSLLFETVRQGALVAIGRKRLPAGALQAQIATMGVDAVFIVGLLSFLLGMTMAFQGAVQLQRLGAGVFVADMIGLSMVRELSPLMTAVILSGRTGAAIAAELGTMKVRSEIDAMTTMGINPMRFLILPRLLAITFIGPALTIMSIFVGVLGGMLVATFAMDLPMVTFWNRIVERIAFSDYLHGIGKSVVFAWIIGLAGSHLGMRARGDASSVGAATTRTVVVSIFFIIVVDAIFATISTILRYG